MAVSVVFAIDSRLRTESVDVGVFAARHFTNLDQLHETVIFESDFNRRCLLDPLVKWAH